MRPSVRVVVAIALLLGVFYFTVRKKDFLVPAHFPAPDPVEGTVDRPADHEYATFGGGCFWCTEAVFLRVKGVEKVVSGYSGGSVKNPTYQQVCDGTTGHAEVVRVTFDPNVVSYPELLEVFWRSHDPTTLNRQGFDTGEQYRSVIFTHSDAQRVQAEKYRGKIDEARVFPKPIVTQILPAAEFYPADVSHQDYFARNKANGYCRSVIQPKLDQLGKVFQDRWKPE